ncbi:MAG: YfiR/HmsC family protein [Candidatus Sericytochromatia bacterium]
MLKKYLIFFYSIITVFLFTFKSYAETMEIPLNIQIPIFLKSLAYDRTIKNNIKIGVLSGKDNYNITDSINNISLKKITHYSFSALNIDNLNSFNAKKIDVLLITAGNKNKLKEVNKIAKKLGILTFSIIPEYIEEDISIVIKNISDKPKIIVNLDSLKKEKRDFSSNFLKICTIR